MFGTSIVTGTEISEEAKHIFTVYIKEFKTHMTKDITPQEASHNEENVRIGNLEKWKIEFAKTHTKLLFELLLQCEEFKSEEDGDITAVLDLRNVCMTAISQLSVIMTPDEARKIFGITTGFSKEEELQVMRESEFCEEY